MDQQVYDAGETRGTASRSVAGRRGRLPLLALALATLLPILSACSSTGSGPTGGTPTPTATATATPTATATATPTATATSAANIPVKVYFSKHPESDSDPNAVFPVDRVSPTLGVATYAIQQLIAGPRPSEASAGYFTELKGALSGSSNCGGADFTITLNMRGTTPKQGTATLRFCRTTSLPGDLSGGRIRAEIDRTLRQFPTITADVILDSTGHCFDDLSGMDMCLH